MNHQIPRAAALMNQPSLMNAPQLILATPPFKDVATLLSFEPNSESSNALNRDRPSFDVVHVHPTPLLLDVCCPLLDLKISVCSSSSLQAHTSQMLLCWTESASSSNCWTACCLPFSSAHDMLFSQERKTLQVAAVTVGPCAPFLQTLLDVCASQAAGSVKPAWSITIRTSSPTCY
ncbi:hypothetical protein VIGAN_11152300 [Vigna angularis var. angularis]|uniref:Uncharacterized protein n=1 Tax=Vigna angularis var. angularis TaxID=157739 RepID=A0A0S3TAY6_PHAAN|nr:hypothetical protein VIGAN_11152300 [Vigna angularis var. angularis]